MSLYDRAQDVVYAIRRQTKMTPTIGVILGSGLKSLMDEVTHKVSCPLESLPHSHVSQVAGHDAQYVIGKLEDVTVVMLSGRTHYYEGLGMQDVALPVVVMHLLGIKHLIITNACGGINVDFEPGDFMMIKDHMNTTGQSPLIGTHDKRLGPRFPSVHRMYNQEIEPYQTLMQSIGQTLHLGVYAFWHGPSYETAAEIKMLRVLGADVVGMSTVPEALMANALGIQTTGFAVITNMATGILKTPHSHEDVLATANNVIKPFKILIKEAIKQRKDTK